MAEHPPASSSAVRAAMQANRRVDTTPEVRLRSGLHRTGLRFRKDFKIQLPDYSCRPDIVFTRSRVAVFVDGCFWHGCPEHYTAPETNADYWTAKLERNQARDKRDTMRLEDAGWTVIRIWECEVKEELPRLISEISNEVGRTGGSSG